jgi:hypothetical protein
MKHGNGFFLELSRHLFTDQYKNLSQNAKWLFVVLNELEQKYTGEKEDYFTRSDQSLSEDSGMSLATLKRAKAELMKTDLIETWKCHFVYKTGKKSEQYYTAYRILK